VEERDEGERVQTVQTRIGGRKGALLFKGPRCSSGYILFQLKFQRYWHEWVETIFVL
jgi:hypothetical protein